MRASGILLHISSLPSNTGIGTLGKNAYEFVDFLKLSGQTYWQVLPICPVGYGYSPYQSYSTFAGNPYFIDFDMLAEDGLLEKKDYSQFITNKESCSVDFDSLDKRLDVLRIAFERFKNCDHSEFHEFENKNEIWISNYAMFMTAKKVYNDLPWNKWDDGLKMRDSHSLWCFKNDHGDEVFFQMFIQFEFYKQWNKLKEYANKNGIKIIGDIPIYVSYDSADVWVNPNLFSLDEKLNIKEGAGCPPDAFSATGQLWGNPVYNWDRIKETDYSWWIARVRASVSIYDVIRIDHFRGFESYYSIPAEYKTAEGGKWVKGPGIDFFNKVKDELGDLPFIAEDLGSLTPEVFKLLEDTNLPGMKILEFAFDPDYPSCYLPHNHIKNSVVYPGTHDNNTIKGWSLDISKRELEYCKKYLNISEDNNFVNEIIRCALSSVCDTAIIQMQDWLELGSEARMNTPSTVGCNWGWRVTSKQITTALSKKIDAMTKLYSR